MLLAAGIRMFVEQAASWITFAYEKALGNQRGFAAAHIGKKQIKQL
jgi:hypothetical protein